MMKVIFIVLSLMCIALISVLSIANNQVLKKENPLPSGYKLAPIDDGDDDFCDVSLLRPSTNEPDLDSIDVLPPDHKGIILFKLIFDKAINMNPSNTENLINLVGGYIYLDTDQKSSTVIYNFTGLPLYLTNYFFWCPSQTPNKHYLPMGAEYCINLYSQYYDSNLKSIQADLIEFNNFSGNWTYKTIGKVSVEVNLSSDEVKINLDRKLMSNEDGALDFGGVFGFENDAPPTSSGYTVRKPIHPGSIAAIDLVPDDSFIGYNCESFWLTAVFSSAYTEYIGMDSTQAEPFLFLNTNNRRYYGRLQLKLVTKTIKGQENIFTELSAADTTTRSRDFIIERGVIADTFQLSLVPKFTGAKISPGEGSIVKFLFFKDVITLLRDDTARVQFIQFDVYDTNGIKLERIYGAPSFIILDTTGVSNINETLNGITPDKWYLSANYPNPFNQSTRIKYGIPKAEYVTIKIYNILGQVIKTIVDERLKCGSYVLDWQGKDNFDQLVSSGVYIIQMKAGELVKVRKILLIR